MKALFLLLFIPAIAFSQNDSVPMPTRDEVLKIAEQYQQKYGFKKELIFSRAIVHLTDKSVSAGAFLAITPQSLIILQKGSEVVIPRDSISSFTLNEIQQNSGGGFGAGFAVGLAAGVVFTNYASSASSPFFLSEDHLIGSLLVGVLAGTGIGYLSDLGSTTQNQYFTLTSEKNENDWAQIIEMLEESRPRGKVIHFSLTSSHVYRNLPKTKDLYSLTAVGDGYTYYPSNIYPFNVARRFSIMISPQFLKNFSVGVAYMNLDEPSLTQRGTNIYRDTAHRAVLNANLTGEGLFGVVAYPFEVFDDTYLKIAAGAGRAIMDYSETFYDDDYHYYPNQQPFPESAIVQKGKYFSLVGLVEFSHLFKNVLSFGMTADYVWVNSPNHPPNLELNIPERKSPFNTFSLGIVTGISF